MKMLGKEIQEFWADNWETLLGDVCELDDFESGVFDGEVEIDDVDSIDLAKTYTLRGLVIVGRGGDDTISLAALAKRWRKTRTHVALAVTLRHEDRAVFDTLAKQHGWKVSP